jgi:hypothetical protein
MCTCKSLRGRDSEWADHVIVKCNVKHVMASDGSDEWRRVESMTQVSVERGAAGMASV